jgi:hypothetical protein
MENAKDVMITVRLARIRSARDVTKSYSLIRINNVLINVSQEIIKMPELKPVTHAQASVNLVKVVNAMSVNKAIKKSRSPIKSYVNHAIALKTASSVKITYVLSAQKPQVLL